MLGETGLSLMLYKPARAVLSPPRQSHCFGLHLRRSRRLKCSCKVVRDDARPRVAAAGRALEGIPTPYRGMVHAVKLTARFQRTSPRHPFADRGGASQWWSPRIICKGIAGCRTGIKRVRLKGRTTRSKPRGQNNPQAFQHSRE
jgi:hypothetical protein